MKEIQGRLKNKNKLRSPLGRVEKKQRPTQPCRLQRSFVVFCSTITCREMVWGPAPAAGPPWGHLRSGCPSAPGSSQQDPAAHLRLGGDFICPSTISRASLASSSIHHRLMWCRDTSLGGKGWSSEQHGRACSPNVINQIKKTQLTITAIGSWTKGQRKPYMNSSIV